MTALCGDHAEPAQVLVGHLVQDVFVIVPGVFELGTKSHGGLLLQALPDDGLQVGAAG